MKSINLTILLILLSIILVTQIQCNSLRQTNKNKHQQKEKVTDLARLSSQQLIKEGWLRISSSNLKDAKRYPALANNSQYIKVSIVGDSPSDKNYVNVSQFDNGNFRKNSQWSPSNSAIPAIDAFYFRLNGENFYYTETPNDMVVLGAIAVRNVIVSKPGIAPGCFEVVDQEQDSWQVCTLKDQNTQDWICAINKALGKSCVDGSAQSQGSGVQTQSQVNIEKKVIVKQPIILIPLPSPDCAKDFNYNSHGSNWICRCNEGLEQSPIDLPNPPSCLQNVKMNANFDYPTVNKDQVKVIYDRNMLRLMPKSDKVNLGRLTDLDGTIYQVTEIQFHTPAEHTLSGKKLDMEVQVIHKAIKGEYKQKAILSILYKQTPGARMTFFEELDILNLPNPALTEVQDSLQSDFNVNKLMYDEDTWQNPPPFNYYKYRGSFTSPPCEEDVIWFVASEPVPLGNTVVNFVRDSLNTPKPTNVAEQIQLANQIQDNFDGNNRDIQKLRNREVFFYDRTKGCIPYEEKQNDKKLVGHYEKVQQKVTKYFYVNSDKPSGLPNSFVVSKSEAEGTGSLSVNQQRNTDRYNIH